MAKTKIESPTLGYGINLPRIKDATRHSMANLSKHRTKKIVGNIYNKLSVRTFSDTIVNAARNEFL